MNDTFKEFGMILGLIFVFSQFISIWRRSNIGIIITSWLATLLSNLELNGIALIVVTVILMSIANIFCPSLSTKWMIFSPIVVPIFMQNNISPQFAQIILRASHSITAGITPLLSFYIIYLGYLNLYNQHKEKPISIRQSISFVIPYFLIITITWILIIVLWYITGLPIGPGVKPTI